jgi:molecular chaperone HtpG
LELNTRHVPVRTIASAQKDSREKDVNDLSTLLFEQARILDVEVPEDPLAFVARLNRLVTRGLGSTGST